MSFTALKRSIAIAICFTAWAVVAPGVASASVEARKLMEFGNVGWEDEMARLDYLNIKLGEEPQSTAYVIVYGGRRGDRRGETQARMACIKDYMLYRRGLSSDRIVIANGGYREESTVELWLAAPGENRPAATPTVSAKEVKFKKGKIKSWRGRCNL
jgi:hypothetical protein